LRAAHEKVIRYGAPIEHVNVGIETGEHMHATPKATVFAPIRATEATAMSCAEGSIMNRPVTDQPMLSGYPRGDGRKGIRNVVAVAYLVECARHVAREIVAQFKPLFGDADFDVANAHHAAPEVHLIGFPGCYPNRYAEKMMERIATHPNVGAVLFVSLGCESMDKHYLADVVRASGRPVDVLTIQERGGTCSTIQQGVEWIHHVRELLREQPTVPMRLDELITGAICGGSNGTSRIAANGLWTARSSC
jgi:altronate hydrolase